MPEPDFSICSVLQKQRMGESAFDRGSDRDVKSAVQEFFLVGVRVDQDLAAHPAQTSQKEAVGIQFRLPSTVYRSAVDLKRKTLRDKILHGLQCRRCIATVILIDDPHLIIKAGHQVKVPDKSTAGPFIDFRLQLIIGLCQAVVVSAELLPAELFQPVGSVIHTSIFSAGRGFYKMGRADQVFHIIQKRLFILVPRRKEPVKFHTAQNVDLPPVFVLKGADLFIIGGEIHSDIRIHVA